MAVNAQLHPERFRPIDEATAKQVRSLLPLLPPTPTDRT